MAYATISLTQALSDLGRRLYDPNSIFWNDAEKTLYLHEAVRTFNAAANYYRADFGFPTVNAVNWYDLTTVAGTLRPFTVTDVDLYTIIEDHLLEPPTGATWTGTNQFNIQDVLQAVQRRRDQLLYDTGCTLVLSTQPTNGTISNTLPETVMDIRRVAWLPGSTFTNSPLWRDDTWAQQSYQRNQSAPGQPSIYKQSTQPVLTFHTDIPPAVAGNYELLTVNAGPVLTVVNPTVFNVPDDWTWVIKWGALADLLSRESSARDPIRASYCENRYKQGVALMKAAPALLFATLAGNTLDIDAVQYADDYRNGWEALPPGTPSSVYTAGLNMIALAAAPSGVQNPTVTVVQNAPFPANGGAFFQFGREDYDAILNYAQHLASFKQGGAEFISTGPLLKQFIQHITYYNDKLETMGEFTDILYDQSQLQEQADPRMATPSSQEQD